MQDKQTVRHFRMKDSVYFEYKKLALQESTKEGKNVSIGRVMEKLVFPQS